MTRYYTDRIDCFLTNMHREGNTFLFRPTVLVERVDRVECHGEKDALKDFVAFLKPFGPKILLVGFDEDTMAVLRKKLKKIDKGMSLYLYTWWKKILNYKRFDSNKTVRNNLINLFKRSPDHELETYFEQTFPATPLPKLTTSLVVARMIR